MKRCRPARRLMMVSVCVMLTGGACGRSGPGTTVVVGPVPVAPASSVTALVVSPAEPSTTAVPASTVPAGTTAVPAGTTTVPATTAAPAMPPATDPQGADPPGAGWPSALGLLATIPVANENGAGYSRELFGYPAKLRGDCDTRSIVLQRDSLSPAQVDPFGCVVVAGDWLSPYDGLRTSEPGDIEIDHVVALKEAWDSGAWAWTPALRAAYGNDVSDLRTLRAVSRTSNRSKGDKDPSNWLPREADVCRYLSDWVAIKARWGLTMDRSEAGRIRNELTSRCPDQRVAPFAPPPAPPAQAAAPTAPVTTVAPGIANAEVYYPNCAAARAAGVAPIRVGEPGYRPGLDGDGDGVACE